eukprot:g2817.t1
MPSSKVPAGKGKGKGKGKRKGKGRTEAEFEIEPCDMIEETRAAAAAIESGNVSEVCKFLKQLFPEGSRRGGAELKCMRRAVSLMDTRWKAEEDRKRKATFSSEDKGVVDAVLMGGCYLPFDAFANMVGYLDHATAIRSTRSSRSWWRMMSGLPPASHLDTSLCKKGMCWADMLTQLKNMRASNPLRSVSRLTLVGGRSKLILGSFPRLAQAAGGSDVLTHLDLTGAGGARKINFDVLAKALPNLKGLAVDDLFWEEDYVRGWLRGLARCARTVKLESLRVNAREFNGSTYESTITDGVLEDLAYGPRVFFMGMAGGSVVEYERGGPSTLRKLWLDSPTGGPDITDGMAAIGANMPHLKELVFTGPQVTDDGWRKFAIARADAATASSNNGNGNGSGSGGGGGDRDRSRLLRIRILAYGTASVPSVATRGLLEDTVSESVTLYLGHGCLRTTEEGAGAGAGAGAGTTAGRAGGGNVSGHQSQFVDCEGALIELSDKDKDKKTEKKKDDNTSKIRVLNGRNFFKGGVGWIMT